jgi:hypothetical protein
VHPVMPSMMPNPFAPVRPSSLSNKQSMSKGVVLSSWVLDCQLRTIAETNRIQLSQFDMQHGLLVPNWQQCMGFLFQ